MKPLSLLLARLLLVLFVAAAAALAGCSSGDDDPAPDGSAGVAGSVGAGGKGGASSAGSAGAAGKSGAGGSGGSAGGAIGGKGGTGGGAGGGAGSAGAAGKSGAGGAGASGAGGKGGTGGVSGMAGAGGGSGAAGAAGGGGSIGGLPIIGAFAANPVALPAGGGTTTLSWTVTGADSLSLDHGIGTVTGTSKDVALKATTIYTLTATNGNGAATASVAVTVEGVTGVDPPTGTRYAAMVAPVDGESFVGPTVDLRLVGVGLDQNNFTPGGPGGGHSQAASLQFFVDGVSVLTVDAASSEYWVFQGFVTSLALAPGEHTVFARATYGANPGPVGQVDSVPVTITVEAAPAYVQTVDMAGDMTLAQAASWVGTPGGRIRVNGHGHKIAGIGASSIDWQYVDFHDLGGPGGGANGVDLTTTGNVTIKGCRFDYSNTVRLSLGGTATAAITGNLFRSSMRQPLGQLPYGDSFPAIQLTGSSTGEKTFAGNNVGAGWVDFQAVNHWTVGGDDDADGNVLIGPRVGIHFDYTGTDNASSSIVVRRNFSHHIYYGGWSQGNNLEAGGNTSLLAEHNVLIGSSWTVRGMAGEFRYNLVLMAGEDWMWLDTGADVHHNVFVGGDNNRSGLYDTYKNTDIRIRNNTLDGLGSSNGGVNAVSITGSETITSNLFMNMPYQPVVIESGTLVSDYNAFWKTSAPDYSDGRMPSHDVHADPQLTNPAVHAYELDERAVWLRAVHAHDVLSSYRTRYMPKPGSPLVDSGDPASFGVGNDIGAIGNGTINAQDRFGM